MFSTSDRFFDVSLRILTVFVLAVLLGCVAFLGWRWMQPEAPPTTDVALTEIEAPRQTVTPQPAEPRSPVVEVLLNPGQIFRCELRGRVTFSEKPCPEGATQSVQSSGARR